MWCHLRLFLVHRGRTSSHLRKPDGLRKNWLPHVPYADADSIHTSAVMIVQGGKVVDQWGDIDKKISSYSVRKSLLSALYGIYSAEGVIDINQTLEQLGIDDSPDPLTKEEKQARIVDLLRARSGVYHPAYMETESMKKNRPTRGSHAP